MNNQYATADTAQERPKERYSQVKVIVDTFFSPSRAFSALRGKPRWLLPLVLCTITVIVSMSFTSSYEMEDVKAQLRSNRFLDAEEVEARIANIDARRAEGTSLRQIAFGVVFVASWQVLQLFALAAVFWLALQLYPQKTGYLTTLSVCSFSYLVLIPEMLLKTPLVVAKKSAAVYLGPAALLPQEWMGSPLFAMFEKLDIFSVWMVILLIFGLRYSAGLSKGKAVLTVGYLWTIWLLVSMFVGDLARVD